MERLAAWGVVLLGLAAPRQRRAAMASGAVVGVPAALELEEAGDD